MKTSNLKHSKTVDCKFEAPRVNERELCLARPEEAVRRGVYSPQDLYTFPATRLGESSTLKVNIRNNSSDTHEVSRGLACATAPAGNTPHLLFLSRSLRLWLLIS